MYIIFTLTRSTKLFIYITSVYILYIDIRMDCIRYCILGINCYSFVVPTRPIIAIYIVYYILNNTFIWLWIILHRRTLAILNLLYELASVPVHSISRQHFHVWNRIIDGYVRRTSKKRRVFLFFFFYFSYIVSRRIRFLRCLIHLPLPLNPNQPLLTREPPPFVYLQRNCLNILMRVDKPIRKR